VACLGRGRRLGAGDGLTWRRFWRSVGAGTTWRRLPLLTLTRPTWHPLWDSRLRDVDVGRGRALEDSVETGRHSLEGPSPRSSSLGDSSSGSPLCLDFARRASNTWRSRFFFFSLFFSKSFADFCFSADWRRLWRSTSSSFTGGLEDRASIGPYASKDKLKEGSKKIQNRSHR